MKEMSKQTEAGSGRNQTFDKNNPNPALQSPIKYEFKWTNYETNDELVAAKDEMTLDEQRKQRNRERENNARQKALTEALDAAGVQKPTLENDEQLRLREFYKVVMSSKRYSEEQARALASSTLGIEWASE